MCPSPSSACFNSFPPAPSGMSNRPFALASTWVPGSVLGWTRPLFWPPWALNSYNIDLCGINWLPLTASPPFLREDPVEFPLPPGANPWHTADSEHDVIFHILIVCLLTCFRLSGPVFPPSQALSTSRTELPPPPVVPQRFRAHRCSLIERTPSGCTKLTQATGRTQTESSPPGILLVGFSVFTFLLLSWSMSKLREFT